MGHKFYNVEFLLHKEAFCVNIDIFVQLFLRRHLFNIFFRIFKLNFEPSLEYWIYSDCHDFNIFEFSLYKQAVVVSLCIFGSVVLDEKIFKHFSRLCLCLTMNPA